MLKFRYVVQIKQSRNLDQVCKVTTILVVGSAEVDGWKLSLPLLLSLPPILMTVFCACVSWLQLEIQEQTGKLLAAQLFGVLGVFCWFLFGFFLSECICFCLKLLTFSADSLRIIPPAAYLNQEPDPGAGLCWYYLAADLLGSWYWERPNR